MFGQTTYPNHSTFEHTVPPKKLEGDCSDNTKSELVRKTSKIPESERKISLFEHTHVEDTETKSWKKFTVSLHFVHTN